MSARIMRVLTLTQPWASLVELGKKRIETRSWMTGYRGRIGIHAARGFPREARERCYADPFYGPLLAEYDGTAGLLEDALPLGEIIATAELLDCVPITETPTTFHASYFRRERTGFVPFRYRRSNPSVHSAIIPSGAMHGCWRTSRRCPRRSRRRARSACGRSNGLRTTKL